MDRESGDEQGHLRVRLLRTRRRLPRPDQDERDDRGRGHDELHEELLAEAFGRD
jgi:hypothetical protein